MNKISGFEVLIYTTIHVGFLVGCYLYSKEIDQNEVKSLSYDERVILWGFSLSQGTSYMDLAGMYPALPYIAVYSLICMLINYLNIPHKIRVSEFVSLGMMFYFHGIEVTGTTLVLMIIMAFIGRCLRGLKFVPQVVGLIVLGYFGKALEKLDFINLRGALFTGSVLCYAGFYAHIVRGMQICCEYADQPKRVSWRQLLSESLGFPAFTNIFGPASFFIFSDWQQWRNGEHQYEWNGPFKMKAKARLGKATVMRKVSLLDLFLRLLWVGFWCMVHKYIISGVDLVTVLAPSVHRIVSGKLEFVDCAEFAFAIHLMVSQFNVFYVVFYNLSRIVGDVTQFFLSPAFSSHTLEEVGGNDEVAQKMWKKATTIERWLRVEVEIECLMPEGPICILTTAASSAIWRGFDVGLYNVLKYYIYIPWMEIVAYIVSRGRKGEKQQYGPILSNFIAICGAAFTFIFVLTFHHWTPGNKIWVTISFILWMIERFVIQANKKYGICDYVERRFSPAWEQRFRFFSFALLQLANMLSFFCFLTNYETGSFIASTIRKFPLIPIILSFINYCRHHITAYVAK